MWQHGSFTTRLLVEQVDAVCAAMHYLPMHALDAPISSSGVLAACHIRGAECRTTMQRSWHSVCGSRASCEILRASGAWSHTQGSRRCVDGIVQMHTGMSSAATTVESACHIYAKFLARCCLHPAVARLPALTGMACVCLQATLAVLHQNVLPCITAPGLNWVITKVCQAQIEAMLDDVKKEVSRVRNGGHMLPCHIQSHYSVTVGSALKPSKE